MNPCTNCRRRPCPKECKPRLDWLRHLAREKRKRDNTIVPAEKEDT